MDQLVDSLMEELNCNTVFTIPLFGGIDVLESVVVTWIIMAIIMIGSLIWVHGLKIRKISGKQAALESGFSFLYNFFLDLLGEEGKDYIPYLITVVISHKRLKCDRVFSCYEYCAGGSRRYPEKRCKGLGEKFCGTDPHYRSY